VLQLLDNQAKFSADRLASDPSVTPSGKQVGVLPAGAFDPP
jgi:hypothetical protein